MMTIRYISFNLNYIFLSRYINYKTTGYIKFLVVQRLSYSLFVHDKIMYTPSNTLMFTKFSHEYLLRSTLSNYTTPNKKIQKHGNLNKDLFDLPKLYNIKYQYYRIFTKYFNMLFLYFGFKKTSKPHKLINLIQRVMHLNSNLLFKFNNLVLYRILLNTRLLFSYSAILTYSKLGLIYVNKYPQYNYNHICLYGDYIELVFNNKLLLIHYYFRNHLRKQYLSFRRKQRLFYDNITNSTDKYRRFEILTTFSKNFYLNTFYIKKFYEIDFQLQSCFILYSNKFCMFTRDQIMFKYYISPTYLWKLIN